VVAEQPFPQFVDGSYLPFDPDELTWHLMDSAAPNLG